MNFKNFSRALTCLMTVAALGHSASLAAKPKIVGYYENWAIYAGVPYGQPAGSGPYSPTPSAWTKFANNIDVFTYAFATFNTTIINGPKNNGYLPQGNWEVNYSDPNDNSGLNLIGQVQALKKINPDMKMVLSIGGWNFTQPQTTSTPSYGQYGWYTMPFFSMMANNQDVSTPTTTGYNLGATGYGSGSSYTHQFDYQRGYVTYNNANRYGSNLQAQASDGCQLDFINSCLYVCNSAPQGWDGIDLDWEYPGRVDRGGIGATTTNGVVGDFTGLLTVLTSLRTGMNPGKILTMATASAGDSPLLADVSWAAGTFSDGTVYPSSTAVMTALGISPITTTGTGGVPWPRFGTNGNTYTYSCFNEYMYFLWMALCAYECDWFNVMTYDYFGPSFTAYSSPAAVPPAGPLNAHLAPLYPAGWNTSSQLATNQITPAQTPTVGPYSLCVDRTIGMYLNAKIPATSTGGPTGGATPAFSINPEKLMLGLPAYGRAYQNTAGTSPTPGSATLNPPVPTPAAPISNQLGYYNYYEITDALQGTGNLFNNLVWDSTSQTSYASSSINGSFCSFDYAGAPVVNGQTPANSIANKCQYVTTNGLGGVMMWAFDCDDTHAGYPVLNAIINGLSSAAPSLGIPGQTNINYAPTNGRN